MALAMKYAFSRVRPIDGNNDPNHGRECEGERAIRGYAYGSRWSMMFRWRARSSGHSANIWGGLGGRSCCCPPSIDARGRSGAP